MNDDDRVTVMQFEEETDQFPENGAKTEKDKKPRRRRTKEEKIKDIEEQKAIYLEKISQLEAKKEKLSLTPAEKKEAKRKAENHCKIVAGVAALELSKKGKSFFTIENFKNRLFFELTQPLEKSFLDKIFKETENK